MRLPYLCAVAVLTIAASATAQAPAGKPLDSFITLGTRGGPIADAKRSQPANVLLFGSAAHLVDSGDGTAEQLAKAGIPLGRVKTLWLSHLHFDHTGGLAAIIGLRYQTNQFTPLRIYGPPGTKALVAGIIQSMQPAAEAGYGLPGVAMVQPASTVVVTELANGQTLSVDGMTVKVAQNTHYSFPPGSEADRRFKSFAYRFDLPDRSIVYTGDTGPSPAVEKLAHGADLLVSEMIDVDATVAATKALMPDKPAQTFVEMTQHLSTHHLTPAQVGELAKRADVKRVVVTHFVAPDATPSQIRDYIAAIHRTFSGPVTIANDLDRF